MKTQKINIRGLQYHIQEWGEPGLPKLFMLHGWMDCGASYKFMAPKLVDQFHIIAPDLRGFGESEHAADGYWFPDYFADLEVLLNHFATTEQVNLLGHSMGGNIVLMYAGIRPQRVSQVLSLEGLGLPPSKPQHATAKYQQWLQQAVLEEETKVYSNVSILKQSIYKANPSLSDEMIDELAVLWGKPVGADGAVTLKHDHRHRFTNPVRYNFDDVREVWGNVEAKVGLVMAENSMLYKRFNEFGRIDEAQKLLRISPAHSYLVEDSDHMLHLQQPAATVDCVLDFFSL